MQFFKPDGTLIGGGAWLEVDGTNAKKQIVDSLEVATKGIVTGGKSVQTVLESTHPEGIIARSPDGSRWILTVSNTGSLSAVKIV